MDQSEMSQAYICPSKVFLIDPEKPEGCHDCNKRDTSPDPNPDGVT